MNKLLIVLILSVTALTAQAEEQPVQQEKSTGLWAWIADHSCGGKWSCSDEKPLLTASEAAMLITSAAIIANSFNGVGAPNYQGPCQFEWQTAKDGSRCGGRAATVRPGGY